MKRALGIEKLEVPDDTGIPEEMKVHNDPKGFEAFEKLVRELGLFDEENTEGKKAKIYNMNGERVDK